MIIVCLVGLFVIAVAERAVVYVFISLPPAFVLWFMTRVLIGLDVSFLDLWKWTFVLLFSVSFLMAIIKGSRK